MSRLRLLALALALAAPAALVPIASATPVGEPRAERAGQNQAQALRLGTRLTTRFWELLRTGDQEGLRAFLAPAFQVQRADGSGATRAQYVAELGRAVLIERYALSDFRVTRTRGSVVVARYRVVTTETIDGQAYSTQPAPRISTFVWTPRGWRMASHANFNAPPS